MTKQEALLKIANLIKEAKQIAKDNEIDINLFSDAFQPDDKWDNSGCTIDDSWNSSDSSCEY